MGIHVLCCITRLPRLGQRNTADNLLHIFQACWASPADQQILVTSTGRTAIGLMGNIYDASARLGDFQVIQASRNAVINPDTRIYFSGGYYTIMGFTTRWHDSEMLRLLRKCDISVTSSRLKEALLRSSPAPSQFIFNLVAEAGFGNIEVSDVIDSALSMSHRRYRFGS